MKQRNKHKRQKRLQRNKHKRQKRLQRNKSKRQKKAAKKQAQEAKKAAKKQEQEAKKIKNRGTGAGGANTNKNGISYENKTDLSSLYSECVNINKNINKIKFNDKNVEFVTAKQTVLQTVLKQNTNIIPAAGCKKPDEVYINNETKTLYIIEKKFQQGRGSVDEKLQTGYFKKEHFEELYPEYKIYYIYCLSDWFKREEYTSEIKHCKKYNIPVFWGNDSNYKTDIVDFICS